MTRIATARGAACPATFVRLTDVAPRIVENIRYAGPDNFTGRPVPGYGAAVCWLLRPVAQALAAVQLEAESRGLGLVVYDGYRPPRASAAFLAWAADPADIARKADYYPRVDKADLFGLGYLAARSAHSTGRAVDIAFLDRDFGTPFDFFDPMSATECCDVGPDARANRQALLALMRRHGFENDPAEWWHFTFADLSNAQPIDIDLE